MPPIRYFIPYFLEEPSPFFCFDIAVWLSPSFYPSHLTRRCRVSTPLTLPLNPTETPTRGAIFFPPDCRVTRYVASSFVLSFPPIWNKIRSWSNLDELSLVLWTRGVLGVQLSARGTRSAQRFSRGALTSAITCGRREHRRKKRSHLPFFIS